MQADLRLRKKLKPIKDKGKEVREMEIKTEQGLFLRFRIDDEKLYKILDDLEKASRIIRECYISLGAMGIVEIKNETATNQQQSQED